MGTYTQLKVNITLSEEAPLDIIEKLSSGEMWEELATAKFGRFEGMFPVSEEPELPIEHVFGKSDRWSQIFSPYTTIFNKELRTLKIDCDIKAYDNIYEDLVDWLKPFIIDGHIEEQGEWQDSKDWTQLYPEN
jgi:hypothetical protein